MKKLLVYLKGYEKECILAPAFKMLEAIFELIVPLVMASIIDVGIAKRDKSHVLLMCACLLLLALVGLISSVTAQYFAARAATEFGSRVRNAVFDKIQKFSFSQIDRMGTSTLITRMTSDSNQVQTGVNMVLRLFLRSPFIVFGAMLMAFQIDVASAWIFALVIVLLSIVVFGIMLVSIPLYKNVQTALDKVLRVTRDNLMGVRVIRAFAREEEEEKIFHQENQTFLKSQLFVGKISALMNPLTYVLINIALVLLLWTGGHRVNTGAISQGAMVALVNYMSQILVELIKLANLIVTITKSVACGNRIQTILETNTDSIYAVKDDIKKTSQAKIRFSNVSLTYERAKEETLSQITFSLKEGEQLGVIGGTGSGKTSLVHLIPAFYQASKGQVEVDGKDVRDWDIDRLRSKIGIAMQKAVLFSGTIRENLLWGNEKASDEELWDALSRAQAKDFVEEKAGGLEAKVEQGGKNFSGGQRQRLTIARALVKKPEILILDDSASALDYATDAALRKAIGQIKNMTIIIVSQRASSVKNADKILVLDDGKCVGLGDNDSLLRDCEVYRDIYYSQYKKEKKGGVL